jgi:hypothetical protein
MVTDEPQGCSNIHQNSKSMINICKIKNSRKNKIWSSDTRLMTRCCVRHEPKHQKALFLCFFCLIFNWFFCIKAGIFQLDFFIGIARTHCKEQKNRKKIQESCGGHAKKRFVEIKYFSEISFFSAGGRAFSCNMIWEISKISAKYQCATEHKRKVLLCFFVTCIVCRCWCWHAVQKLWTATHKDKHGCCCQCWIDSHVVQNAAWMAII